MRSNYNKALAATGWMAGWTDAGLFVGIVAAVVSAVADVCQLHAAVVGRTLEHPRRTTAAACHITTPPGLPGIEVVERV